ncbi:MAG: DUF883 C-terminal domain-containing protein [Acidobacteriota bacterium]
MSSMRDDIDQRTAQLRDGYSRVQDKLQSRAGDLSRHVRENPGQAVLLAIGAGFLVGLLFRGRRQERD